LHHIQKKNKFSTIHIILNRSSIFKATTYCQQMPFPIHVSPFLIFCPCDCFICILPWAIFTLTCFKLAITFSSFVIY
jgi:hypothetical protein